MPNAATKPELLSTEQAAEYLGGLVSVNTLVNWRCTKRYDLPFVKLGRKVAYRKRDLDAFIESRTVRSTLWRWVATNERNGDERNGDAYSYRKSLI